jgi:hypothetical protein
MDLKLLLGAGFMEVLNAVFPVLACRKPANTILIPTKCQSVVVLTSYKFHLLLLSDYYLACWDFYLKLSFSEF